MTNTRFLRLAVTLLLVLTSSLCGAATAPQAVQLQTEHYDLYIEGAEAEQVGRMLEVLYTKLKEVFGAGPHERLRVKVFSTRERYLDAMHAETGTIESDKKSCGLYDAENRTAYTFIDENAYAARGHILHECTHQFHFLARTANKAPLSDFYAEGVAHHFETHRFNGKTVEIGVVPEMAWVDGPENAVTAFRQIHAGSLRALGVDGRQVHSDLERGAAWGLVSFVLEMYPDRFRKWSAALDSLQRPEAAWDSAFGSLNDRDLSEQYLAWLARHQESWQVRGGSWDSVGAGTIWAAASPRRVASAILKRPDVTMKGSVQVRGDQARAGFVMGYESDDRFHVLDVKRTGNLKLLTKLLPGTKWASSEPLDEVVDNPTRFDFEITKRGRDLSVSIDGSLVLKIDVPEASRIGLAVTDGPVIFQGIKIVEADKSGTTRPSSERKTGVTP